MNIAPAGDTRWAAEPRPAETRNAETRNAEPPANPNSPRVLVVDDDEMNREVLTRLLKRNGYVVSLAEDGRSALDLAQRQTFDLVLLDQMMPNMSGMEVLRILRTRASASELPIIMVTAKNQSEEIVAALEAGANDYVGKPIDFAVTIARIKTHLHRSSAERSLRQSEERYELATRGADLALWDWDLHTGRVYYSPRWKDLLGYSPNELGDSPEEWLGRIHPADAESVREQVQNHRAGCNHSVEIEHRLLHRDGSYRWMLGSAAAVRGLDGQAIRIAGSLKDVTESKITDQLTGLANRLHFEQKLEGALAGPDPSVAVLLLDVDRFKIINDSLGHHAGDSLLKEIGARICQVLQAGPDSVARFGADEFLMILPLAPGQDPLSTANTVLEAVKEPFRIDGQRVLPSASIGIACSGAESSGAESLLRNAEAAMYHAKSLGKGNCAVFQPQMHDRAVARLQIEAEMRDALHQDQFTVWYQPKVNLLENKVIGFEALVRWRHPQRGLVSPAEFIPVAEENGLISEIGLLVLHQACRDLAAWRCLFPCAAHLTVSVNVSSRQLARPGLVQQVRDALRETGLTPGSLSLEVTESVVMENNVALELLNQIREIGVGLDLDDFGTGYSSLGYLHRFPFNTLKIDQSFVKRLHADSETGEIVRTIIQLAHTLGMIVVAEGIETQAQNTDLKSWGCELGQGYLFSRPVDSAGIENILRNSIYCQ
jgi:diguanylate cyclase (GGDEF)-like protein/PAS domain S-box-containing protein